MHLSVSKWMTSFFDIEKKERLKIIYLGVIFLFIVGGYTVVRELKDSIFISMVGRQYIPWAKLGSIFILIPLILFYSKLVDKLRRYKLLYVYSMFYAVVGLIFTYFLGHQAIGLPNTDQGPTRLFGWVFYFFIEGYSPFVLSVFWAFANSITSPDLAKKGYGLMIAFSKVGGLLTAGLAWILMHNGALRVKLGLNDTTSHQILFGVASLMLLLVPFLITKLMNKVPGYNLHGYEAAYKFEKARSKAGESETGIFSGLKMFIQQPYILGIFSMLFFYEMFNMVLNYQRLHIAQISYDTLSGRTGFLFQQMFATHTIGLFLALFGTGALLKFFGQRKCLLLIPLGTAVFVLYFLFNFSPTAIIVAYIGIRSINYAFSYPIRESLYIPTVKEMKFKSKSWIDAFGTRMAKATGHSFNAFVDAFCQNMFFAAHAVFFSLIIGLWLVSAYLLGKRFQKLFDRNEVIGEKII